MDKIAQFLEHARDCMELSAKAPGEQSEALIRIAEYWTALARERRQEREAREAASAPSSYLTSPAQKRSSLH